MQKKQIISIFLLACAVVVLAVSLTHLTEIFAFCNGILSALSPIIVGLCMAFVFNVIMSAIESKLLFFMDKSKKGFVRKLKRTVALILTLLVAVGMIIFLVTVITPSIARAAEIIVKEFPGMFNKYSKIVLNFLAENNINIKFIEQGQIKWEQVFNSVVGWLNISTDNVVSVATGVFSGLFNFILSFILSIYVLLSKEKIAAFLHLLMRTCLKSRTVKKIEKVSRLTYKTFARFITGQFAEAVILGALCFFGMLIFRIPLAPVISVVVGVTALVPMFGAWIGGAVGAFFILMEDPIKALIFVIFILVLQQLEGNIIYPKVVGDSIGLPGILVLCAVILGGDFGGIPGILFGVPVTSVLYTLLKEYANDKARKRAELHKAEEEARLAAETKENKEPEVPQNVAEVTDSVNENQ